MIGSGKTFSVEENLPCPSTNVRVTITINAKYPSNIQFLIVISSMILSRLRFVVILDNINTNRIIRGDHMSPNYVVETIQQNYSVDTNNYTICNLLFKFATLPI